MNIDGALVSKFKLFGASNVPNEGGLCVSTASTIQDYFSDRREHIIFARAFSNYIIPMLYHKIDVRFVNLKNLTHV